MSFADRLKSKIRGVSTPEPEPEMIAPTAVAAPKATNDNNFIPTKYGEELPHAVRTYLPRGVTATPKPVTVNIADESAFPSLGGGSGSAPKTNSAMNRGGTSWADKAREWAVAAGKAAEEEEVQAAAAAA